MRKYFPVEKDLDGFNEFLPSDHIPVAGLPDAIRDQKSAWLNTISVRAVFSAEVEDGDLVVPVVRDETNDWYHPDTVWVPALGPDAVMHAETETSATYQPKFYGMAYKGINRVMLGPLVYHPTYKFRAGDILYATANGKMTTEQTEVFVGACLAPGYVLLHGTAQNIDLFKKAAELTERAETAAETATSMADKVVEVGESQIVRLEALVEQLLVVGVSYNRYAVSTLLVPTPAGQQIALPYHEGTPLSYIVGANNILLIYNGTWMLPGEQYTEVGNAGLPSSVIQLNQELRAGDKLGVLILSQYVKVLLANNSGLIVNDRGELMIAPVQAKGSDDIRTLSEWAAAIRALEQPVLAERSTTARPLVERFADIVNVKDFGAVGDGIADDTQAVQAATSRALALGAGVYFPAGNYVVTSVYDSSLLYGEGLLLMAGVPMLLPSVLRCSARIDAATEYSAELANAIMQLDSTKMDKAQASEPFNFRGSVLFADLPAVGDVNDTYYVTDLQYNMTWDGSKWSQSTAPVSGLSGLLDNCVQGHPQNVDADNMVELCGGDIDKLPVNRVYAIASNTDILNTPVTGMGGLYLPMGKLPALTGATGAIFITFERQLYARIWNATSSKWEAWKRFVDDTELTQMFQGHPTTITASNMVAVCNGDASNLLPERVYIIAAGTGIQGLPEDTGGSYLVYNRGPLLSAGATAIFVTLNGNMYYRNRPNSSGVWSAWHRVIDQAYLAPYVHGVNVITATNAESICGNNLDTLASNTIYTVAAGVSALAGTPVPGEGGCITILSRNSGNASGSCRLFHSYYGDLSHAARSGAGWNPWKRAVSHDIPRVLALGDSICYGARNSNKGFVGDLHYETKNVGISGTRLSSTHPSAEPIFKQLDSVGDFQPDVIIFDGGINDYVQHVPLGEVPTAPTAPTSTDTLLGGMQKLLYEIKTRYPFCQVFFVAVHKMQYAPIGYCPATKNSAGYTQTDMTNAQKALCHVFGVQVVDVFGESMLDTSFSAYLGAVGSDAWCDDDGVHPLPNGYIHAYVPLIKRALISVTRK